MAKKIFILKDKGAGLIEEITAADLLLIEDTTEVAPVQRISTTVEATLNGDTGIPEYHVDLLADHNKFIYDYEIEGSHSEYHIILPTTAPEDFVFDKEYHFAPKRGLGFTTIVKSDALIDIEIKRNEVLIARPLYANEFNNVIIYNISKRILEIPQPEPQPETLIIALSAVNTDLTEGLVHGLVAPFDLEVISFVATAGVPPEGGDIELSIYKNGVDSTSTPSAISSTNTLGSVGLPTLMIGGFSAGDTIDFNIDSVGLTETGQNLKVALTIEKL